MRIACVTHSLSRRGGGVSEALRRLSIEMARQEHTVNVLGIADEDVERDLPQWRPIEPAALLSRGPAAIGRLPQLPAALQKLNPDIVHTHGLWKRTSADVVRWSRRSGRPYAVSPHGMLDPWALRNSRWKKRLALAWFESRHLANANCLHALNESEYRAIRGFGLTNPVCIVPNAVDLPDRTRSPVRDCETRTLAFLGRLHPKKGLYELLEAWAVASREGGGKSWRLLVAGWDDGGHEAKLQSLAQRLGIEATATFVGPKFGEQKQELLEGAAAFVLPSHSEGLPLTILEAWAYGLPAVMTDACNLPEGLDVGAAIRTTPDASGLAGALRELFAMSGEQLAEMGRRGRALVERTYQWPLVAGQILSVYRWLVHGSAPPPCVRFE